jgi:hypothetical protein
LPARPTATALNICCSRPRLEVAADEQPWETFLDLDDVLADIAAGADERLAFQARYPIGRG